MVKHKPQPFDIINTILQLLLACVFIYPFIYIISISISDTFAVGLGLVKFLPIGFQLDAYRIVLRDTTIWSGYANSILYTVTGTALSLLLCSLPAYVLATSEFRFKKSFTAVFVITMFFNGGIIPTFLVVRNLGLLDSIWAIIIPPALSAWNIILFRTNFKSIPISLIESAKMDGASHVWIFTKLTVPLSKAIFAVIGLFIFVAAWNSYFPALLYLTSQDKQPLMIVLRKYIVMQNMRGIMERSIGTGKGLGDNYDYEGLLRSIRMTTVVVSVLPVLMVYPFMQKFLAKGILVGSIKG